MSSLSLSVQLVEATDSGKKRIVLGIVKDENLEISVVLTADEAKNLANGLLELERKARGKQIILPGGGLA